MTLTQKETSLLTDLKAAEQLCIEKYAKYAAMAKDEELKSVFSSIKETEVSHLSTITELLSGKEVPMSSESPSATEAKLVCEPSGLPQDDKKEDAFLVKDALSMEKHVSGVYNTAVFEFCSPVVRDTLAHIQKEEQNHGEMLYNYLECNGMYN